MKFRVITTTLLAVVCLALVATAQTAPPAGMQRPMHSRIMDDLKLTDSQKAEIEKLQTETQKSQIDRRSEIAKARLDLQGLFKAETPSQSAIEKKLNEIVGLENRARTEHLNHWFTINKMLTPDQQKIWKQTLPRHVMMGSQMGMGNRSQRMGRMGSPRAPRMMEQSRPPDGRGRRR